MKAIKSITAIMLMCVMAINFTSCSKDDNDEGSTPNYQKLIVGTWVNGTTDYQFSSGGTGWSHPSSTTSGHFKYTLQGTSILMYDFTYVNSEYQSVWHGEDENGYYDPDEDVVRIKGKIYTRNK